MGREVSRQTSSATHGFYVLYDLVRGLEDIHADVHSQNILIQPRGIRFEIKQIDFYDWGHTAPWKLKQDIANAIKVFYECVSIYVSLQLPLVPLHHNILFLFYYGHTAELPLKLSQKRGSARIFVVKRSEV